MPCGDTLEEVTPSLEGSLHVVVGDGREVAGQWDPDTVFGLAQIAPPDDVGHESFAAVGVDRGREHDTGDRTHDPMLAIRLDRGPEARRAHLALRDLVHVHLERGAVQGVPHVIGQRNLGSHQTVDHGSSSCCSFSAPKAQTYDCRG